MSTQHASIPADFVSVVAGEIASGVDAAVELWMVQVERALDDVRLTTLGRMNAVRAVLTEYKQLTGKTELHGRRGRGEVPAHPAGRRL